MKNLLPYLHSQNRIKIIILSRSLFINRVTRAENNNIQTQIIHEKKNIKARYMQKSEFRIKSIVWIKEIYLKPYLNVSGSIKTLEVLPIILFFIGFCIYIYIYKE